MNGNGILLKSDRIILPELLQELTIQLAQRGYGITSFFMECTRR